MNEIVFAGIKHNCLLDATSKESKIVMYAKLIENGGTCPICEKYNIWRKLTITQRMIRFLTKPLFTKFMGITLKG